MNLPLTMWITVKGPNVQELRQEEIDSYRNEFLNHGRWTFCQWNTINPFGHQDSLGGIIFKDIWYLDFACHPSFLQFSLKEQLILGFLFVIQFRIRSV